MAELLTPDIEALEDSPTNRRDTDRLRRYFEAYALNSAGTADHKTIYDAAGLNKATASAYERLLTQLPVVEQVPAWVSNRLKRLVQTPKRYVVDPRWWRRRCASARRACWTTATCSAVYSNTFVMAQL